MLLHYIYLKEVFSMFGIFVAGMLTGAVAFEAGKNYLKQQRKANDEKERLKTTVKENSDKINRMVNEMEKMKKS